MRRCLQRDINGRSSSSLGCTGRRPRPSPYERLKQAILTGELVPGQQLVETPWRSGAR
ncbi:hypothetical protein ACFQX6_33350 [Streptosporangium lutulentum]